jgi:hypothetical protein
VCHRYIFCGLDLLPYSCLAESQRRSWHWDHWAALWRFYDTSIDGWGGNLSWLFVSGLVAQMGFSPTIVNNLGFSLRYTFKSRSTSIVYVFCIFFTVSEALCTHLRLK